MADSKAQHALRVDPELMKAIDERAGLVGLSRNAWIAKALAWALEQPVRRTTVVEKL